jgi:hypothetical protein
VESDFKAAKHRLIAYLKIVRSAVQRAQESIGSPESNMEFVAQNLHTNMSPNELASRSVASKENNARESRTKAESIC